MISFACQRCGKSFSVPEAYAGRSARCKSCGSELKIPAPVVPAEAPVRPVTLSPRHRRLLADAEQIRRLFADCPHIRIVSMQGDPPDLYEVEYQISSLERDPRGKPRPRNLHLAQIQLTLDYPRLAPRCTMLTPIFHPNINQSTICVGDHWTAGERLADLIVRIGEMIAYQAYNIRSPLDGEAAMWADLNADKLPLDARNLRPATME
ncbi:MAG: ubiquitin-conjugating enzyme E2 [Phycisphaerae bacterium]|nr:ubiquitin-conjugating enzyme E2 [Phycisphaerae bacterium]MDW8261372.1 ubiquitin-conjugating enzyme E2 [Phycisphaerales bacterium]